MIDVNFNPENIIVDKVNTVDLCLSNTSSLPVYRIHLVISLSANMRFLSGKRRISLDRLDSGQSKCFPVKVKATKEGLHHLSSRQFSYRTGQGENCHISDLSVPLKAYHELAPAPDPALTEVKPSLPFPKRRQLPPESFKEHTDHEPVQVNKVEQRDVSLVVYKILKERFNMEEFETLCFHLKEVNFDNLSGKNLSSKSRELVSFYQRRKQIQILIQNIVQIRPDIAIDLSD